MSVNIDSIKRSYGRCLISHSSKKQFFESFYGYLLASDPIIKSMFANTDFTQQIAALKHGVSMIIMYAEDKNSIASDVLKKIQSTHSTEKLDVGKEQYKLWERSLITTLREHDPKFDDQLDKEWCALIEETVEYLLTKKWG